MANGSGENIGSSPALVVSLWGLSDEDGPSSNCCRQEDNLDHL